MNLPKYEIWIRDPQSTQRKALIDDWTSLEYRPVINNYAGFSFKLHQDSEHLQYITAGDWVEIVRKIQNPITLEWVTQTFAHIVLAREREVSNGKASEYITISGLSFNCLLASRRVLPPTATESSGGITMTAVSGSAKFVTSSSTTLYRGDKVTPTTAAQARIVKDTVTGTDFECYNEFTGNVTTEAFTITRGRSVHTDHADDVMKAFVRECLVSATDTSRNLAYVSVDADKHEAESVTWTSRYGKLIDILRDLSANTDLDFDMVFDGATGQVKFYTYYPQLGEDRRIGNTQGNAPVVFAVEFDNIQQQRWWQSALAMVDHGGNYIYVGGTGYGVDRKVLQRQVPASILSWGRWENFVDGRDATTDAELTDKADAAIEELARLDSGVNFENMMVDSCIWGVHYNLGDLVTVKIWRETNTFINDQIISIEVSVDNNGYETARPLVGSEYPRFDRRFGRLKSQQDKEMSLD